MRLITGSDCEVSWWRDFTPLTASAGSDEELRRAVLEAFVEPLVGTAVDTVFFRIDMGNQYLCCDTEAGEFVADVEEELSACVLPPHAAGVEFTCIRRLVDNWKMFRAHGFDPYHAIIDRCHEVGIKVFMKIRMNDIHHALRAFFSGGGLRASKWVRSHPEYRLGFDGDFASRGVRRPWRLALDFAHEEVRAQRLAVIEEVCQRYEVDGFMLNFMRHPHYFRKNEVKKGLGLMSDMMREAKVRMKEIGERRGRPISLVAYRLPAYMQGCLNLGLDVPVWIREGLVDIVIPDAHFSCEPGITMGEFVAAAVGTGCEVLAKPGGDTPEKLRGMACNYLEAGIDGFVLPAREPPPPLAEEVVHPEAMTRGDKHYVLQGPQSAHNAGNSYDSPPQIPLMLEPGAQSVVITVADDLESAAAEDALEDVLILLQIANLTDEDGIELALNGTPVPPDRVEGVCGDGWLKADLSRGPLPRQGDNRLEMNLVQRSTKGSHGLHLIDVELLVRYR